MAEARRLLSLDVRCSASPRRRLQDLNLLPHPSRAPWIRLHFRNRQRSECSLCRKDGITLHCPHVKEAPSLWENPYSATTSWKPCAERRAGGISDLPPENETNGFIFIHKEGGLNQQRIAEMGKAVNFLGHGEMQRITGV